MDGWLADRPRPWMLGLGGPVAAFVVGAVAAYQLRYGLALLAALVLVVVVLLRPFWGGLALVGLVPILSGLAPGVPVPYVRVSEALIGLIGGTLLVSARRDDAVPWGALDWLLLAYGALWAFYGAFDGIALARAPHPLGLGHRLRPAPVLPPLPWGARWRCARRASAGRPSSC